jgi:NAD(P)H-dependent flavin oxidoreductase YrpB (nitropropane dioxygenase family)
MTTLTELVGVERPVVQAGMGGGLSGARLAAAVSAAGGLGTIGFDSPEGIATEIEAARRLTDRPVAANLLLPFARGAHWEAAAAADVVVTFWGRPRRRTERAWIHQCGSVEEALAAAGAGADAVIAQGAEAGGHVRGTVPAAELLAGVRRALGSGLPVLSAGGVAEPADVADRMEVGADAVVCGTRFLLAEESGAHPEYKRRLLAATETIVTELFGAGWPAPHRVVANAATERWLRSGGRGPRWLRALNRGMAPLLSRAPAGLQRRLAAAQSPGMPLLGPVAATEDGPEGLVDAGPLYAGECVARIADIRPAGELVRELGAGA